MDDTAHLVNDDTENYDEIADIGSEISGLSIDAAKHLGPQLNSSKITTYSSSNVFDGCYTLRECNELYGKSKGCKWENNELAEFDRCYTKGCISPLRRFTNKIGHFADMRDKDDNTFPSIICFAPQIYTSLTEFRNSIRVDLARSMRSYKLWSISNCKHYIQDSTGTWSTDTATLDAKLSSAMTMLSASFPDPLSAHTQHAFYESEDSKDFIQKLKVFVQPEETTAGPGIFGTLHNNEQIDLAQEPDSSNIDMEARYRDVDIPGFLCAGHTAHSTEAGRVRRVCCDVSVRVLNNKLLQNVYDACDKANQYNVGKKQWLLFCMGKMIYCTTRCILALRDSLISSSSTDINTATLYINSDIHTAMLSITSGVLLRRDAAGIVVDTISLYSDEWPDNKYNLDMPPIDTEIGMRYYFSGFFQLIPYIVYDRPPRTLISSVQSIQAVTTPYGAGTSSVAPVHASKPLVTTPLAEAMLTSPDSKLADLVPGEDLMVAFANFNDTNEDSIMISKSAADRGLYAHMAYSKHLINGNETVPEVGSYVNMYEHRWWKVYSQRQDGPPVQHKFEGRKDSMEPFLAGGDGRGKIISKASTDSGQISVKVLRYTTPVTGDKLATGHGQKGVIKVTKDEDMPWGVDESGQVVKFDIIVSLSSISNRLTTGQYYEMVAGATAAREGKRLIIQPGKYTSKHMETVLYDGKTGDMIDRVSDEGDVPILASWGIYRVWQMTQLSWDKQHYTHTTAGKYSISTGSGRTAGGGLRFGEMEAHATEGSGFTAATNELKKRMDCIDTSFCTKHNVLPQMCLCETDKYFVPVSIPYSMIVFSYASLLTTGHIMKFKLDN
jgi:hypothetical protein